MSPPLPRCWTLHILEGDEVVRESLCALAASNGWHYRAFDRADDFLADGAAAGPACLLVNWDLPNVQPQPFLALVRERYPDLPLVVMTARDDDLTLTRIGLTGTDAILPRPFSLVELTQAVSAAFQARDAEAQRKLASAPANLP